MKRLKLFLLLTTVTIQLCFTSAINAQSTDKRVLILNTRQESIVTISAFTAKGDMVKLQQALNEGLDSGLSINEIKEVLVQLYAYAGFPRSLNALNTFMTVLKERKQKGITDELGKASNPLPANKTKLELGTELQTQLVGSPVKGEVYEFAPVIDQFLKEHLFGDIFGRDLLDFKTREIATISALASLGGAENQLRSHFNVGMHNGLTESQLNYLVYIIQTKVGIKEGNSAHVVLQMVLKKTQSTMEANLYQKADTIFSKGERITNNNFKGNAWLETLVANDSLHNTQVGSVTFEPGARTNWHLHPGGQILLATGGIGYYQEKGSPKRILRKGDVIKCPPNIAHWHGASNDAEFIQIAITTTLKGLTVWLDPVTDEEYSRVIKP